MRQTLQNRFGILSVLDVRFHSSHELINLGVLLIKVCLGRIPFSLARGTRVLLKLRDLVHETKYLIFDVRVLGLF